MNRSRRKTAHDAERLPRIKQRQDAQVTSDVSGRPEISRIELVAMLGMITATVAFSIDAMLPVLPEMGDALSPANPQAAQLVIASFAIGLGIGTIFAGPLTDAWGRKRVALIGGVIYTASALVAAVSQNLEAMLLARAVQGFGAAGPRVAVMALIRDMFSGRHMAQVTSYIMIVFTLVPVLAPSIGAGIAWAFGWRAIFLSFVAFSFISITWLLLRQPETLREENRRPFRLTTIWRGTVEVLSNRDVALAITAQSLLFGILFSSLLSSQAVFDILYDKAASFPLWFGLMSALSASASFLNATLVMSYGMHRVVALAILAQATLTALFIGLQLTLWSGVSPDFAATFVWMTSVFLLAGLGIGNLNAISLEPMGHMAGMAATVVTAIATVVGMSLGSALGQMFNGTILPLTAGCFAMGVVAFLAVRRIERRD